MAFCNYCGLSTKNARLRRRALGPPRGNTKIIFFPNKFFFRKTHEG